MCREPILQSGENMKKNVLMENLIKSKFPKEYEEKLKAKKLAYESELMNSEQSSNSHFSFPSIIIKDNFIWPGQVKSFKLENPLYLNTLRVTSHNDRSLVLIPFESFTVLTENLTFRTLLKVFECLRTFYSISKKH